MSDKIKCPKCGTEIPINQVLIERLNAQVDERVAEKLIKQKDSIEKQFQEKHNIILEGLSEKLNSARHHELEMLKKQNELEDKFKSVELESARKLHEEKKIIEEKALKSAESQFQLKFLEKEKQLEDTKKALFEAQRKAQQGSMQTQGEVFELSLEDILKKNFPHDKIEPVPKGISGADIIQHVYNNFRQAAGNIVWELKQTKNWTEEWIQKLKDDSRNVKANLCVLVSEVLPKDIDHIGYYKGIWVCDFSSVIGLTTALRGQLILVSNAIVTSTGKDQKMEALYNYLCSDTFAQRVQALVETFLNMKSNLEKEKIAMQKIWGSRESQLVRLTDNTAKMYGEIQGIAGKSLPDIELLELEAGDTEKEEFPKTKKPTKDDTDQSSLFV